MKHLFVLGTAMAVGMFGLADPERPQPSPVRSAAAPETLQMAADLGAAIRAAGWNGDRWGVMVVSLDGGDTLFTHNPDVELTPASNVKLFTTAAALHYLRPDFRYATYVSGTGRVSGGVLEGDLLVYGTGDPTLSDRFQESKLAIWEALADSLAALGIRRIRGDVVGDASYFEGPAVGLGWETAYVTHTYAARSSALSYNDNVVTLRVTPGPEAGAPPAVQLIPGGGMDLRNEALTVASGRSRIEVRRASYDAPIVLHGQIARGHSGLWRAVPVVDPAGFAASVFLEVLRGRGIVVDGQARSILDADGSPVTSRSVFAPAFDGEDRAVVQVLAVHRSPPLIEVLKVVNQRSHNMYAEAVLRTVGRVAGGPGSVAGGAAAVAALLEEAGVSTDRFHLDDGSGLSTLNRASAAAIVDLLAFMERSSHWDAYWETLPEAAVSRGLRRMQQTPAAGNLRAKTGTIRRVSALSGYVRARNGERLAFSILSNDVPSTWQAKRVEDRIGARLAAFDRSAPGTTVAVTPTPGVDRPRPVEAADRPDGDATPAADMRRYVVRPGDTLDGIARRNGVRLAELQAANPGVEPRRLMPGQTLALPAP